MQAEIFTHLVHWDIPELRIVPGTQKAVTSFWMNNVTDTFAFPKSHLLSHWFQGPTLCYLECQVCLGILVRFLHTLLGCYNSTVLLVPLLKVSHAPAHQNVLAMFFSQCLMWVISVIPDNMTKESNTRRASEKVSLSKIHEHHWYGGWEDPGIASTPILWLQLEEHCSLNR